MHLNLNGGRDPNVLYNIQTWTNNLLKGAYYNNDYETLDELAGLYLIAYDYLEERNMYVYSWPDIEDHCKRRETIPLQTPSGSAMMWVYHNHETIEDGYEHRLASAQFLYLVSNAINIFLGIPQSERTANMNELISRYSPVIIQDHYLRWIYDDNEIFQVKGWGCEHYCTIPNYNHYDFLQKKLNREFGTYNDFSHCNLVTDFDWWVIAGVVEILAANKKSPTTVILSPADKQKLLDYTDLGIRLLESRMSESQLNDLDGDPVEGAILSLGEWRDHCDYAYAGYTGTTFPTESDKATAITGWDTSHGRRLVHLFETLHENRDVTGKSFPDDGVMAALTNQVVYGTFNRDFNNPLFSNFLDGTNGWYRVGYNGEGFAYAPYDLSRSIMTGGYGFWGKYNPDMNRIMEALWDYAQRTTISDPYKCYCYMNYARGCCNSKRFDKGTSLDLLMFLPVLGPEPPSTPSLISPYNGASFDHNAQGAGGRCYVAVNIVWSDVSDATRYTLATDGPSGYDELDTTSTSQTVKYYGPGDFTWKVKACNDIECSDWSATRHIKVSGPTYPGDEVCNNLDDDCNGITDDGCDDDNDNYCDSAMSIVGTPTTCPWEGNDCNDNRPDINPGATELCDGMDNDCNGRTDYITIHGDLTRTCGPENETGICEFGFQRCSSGEWGSCNDATYPDYEACNGLDNDCDGVIDDVGGGSSVEATHCQCYNGGPPLPSEVCPHNGIDDDCNGQIDDRECGCDPGDTQPCILQSGVCQGSEETCAEGGVWLGCDDSTYLAHDSGYESGPEASCDGLDNDCDGIIDDVGGGSSVEATHCQCYNGGPPLTSEVCPHNGIDDDCNGQIDDRECGCDPGDTQPCILQSGVCQGSEETCPEGGVWLGCDDSTYLAHDSGYEPGPETSCDGLDNDCDGESDEGLKTRFYRDSDGDGYGDSLVFVDECSQPTGYVTNSHDCDDAPGIQGCPSLPLDCGNFTSTCAICINPDAVEICDGIDNNCDGDIDPGCSGSLIIEANYYDGRTTNFTSVVNATNINNMVLEKSSSGTIEFLRPVIIPHSVNLNPPNTQISENMVSINSDNFPFLNVSARISLYDIEFSYPVILRNGRPCDSNTCHLISYSNNTLIFEVTGFTGYSVTESCYDGTLYGECSSQKPSYCLNGDLVNRASICGCPSGYEVDGDGCKSLGVPHTIICTEGEKVSCEKEGVCRPSYQTCHNNSLGPCLGPDSELEICDGRDNDCNGLVDDGIVCMCTNGDTRICGPFTEEGECKYGISMCNGGRWGSCENPVHPSAELCDGLDNDCDGEVDNDCASDICIDGEPVPPEGCLCGGEVRSSGHCCSGIYSEEECTDIPWWVISLMGIVMLIFLGTFIIFSKHHAQRLKYSKRKEDKSSGSPSRKVQF